MMDLFGIGAKQDRSLERARSLYGTEVIKSSSVVFHIISMTYLVISHFIPKGCSPVFPFAQALLTFATILTGLRDSDNLFHSLTRTLTEEAC